jgi:sporulation protein YlmC with PRC-barrel domain
MILKSFAIIMLAATTLSGAASAQTTANPTNPDSNAAAPAEGGWRGSKFSGVNVYNDANEKIGDINDVIVDRSGKITNVVVGVGGFLGMGEHYVSIPYEKFKWVDQPLTATTSSTTAPAGTPATTTAPDGSTRITTGTASATTTTTTTTRASDRWYPDHAVYNANKDELKGLPEFKY